MHFRNLLSLFCLPRALCVHLHLPSSVSALVPSLVFVSWYPMSLSGPPGCSSFVVAVMQRRLRGFFSCGSPFPFSLFSSYFLCFSFLIFFFYPLTPTFFFPHCSCLSPFVVFPHLSFPTVKTEVLWVLFTTILWLVFQLLP